MGIVPFAADESYEAVVLDAEKAKLLGVNAGNCAFYHQRLTRTEDGRIYEYTRSFIRGALASRLDLRITPQLLFERDDSMDQGARIDRLLKDIKSEEK